MDDSLLKTAGEGAAAAASSFLEPEFACTRAAKASSPRLPVAPSEEPDAHDELLVDANEGCEGLLSVKAPQTALPFLLPSAGCPMPLGWGNANGLTPQPKSGVDAA